MSFLYKVDYVSEEQLLGFFKQNSSLFFPPLEKQVDLSYYAQKIRKKATTFEIWKEERLVSLVAVYLNNFKEKTAFITLVLCVKEFQGKGLTTQIFERMISDVSSRGFKKITLEVDISNSAARSFYSKFSFIERNINEKVFMGKSLTIE